MKKSIVAVGVTLLLVGCGQGINNIDDGSQLHIKGGRTVSSNSGLVFRTTIGITSDKYLAKKMTFCSGTIVGKRTILTAAHCLTEDASTAMTDTRSLRVTFGARDYTGWQVRGVTAQGWHKGYLPGETTNPNGFTPPNDVALLRLDTDIPSDFTPISIDWDSNLRVGQQVALAGNGTSNGMDSTGILRYVMQSITNYDSVRKRIEAGVHGEDNSQGACAGDSGGPLFVNVGGEWKVRGVLSIGTSNPSTGYCYAWNAYTDAAVYKDRILNGARALAQENVSVISF